MTDTQSSSNEIVRVGRGLQSGKKWQPVIGEETLSLLDNLDIQTGDRNKVQNEAVAVLSRCLPPTDQSGRETGLVIGYVQSGKTMSFTTLSALAHDNRFKLIIIISGMTRNLFQQSTQRLEDDLRIRHRNDRRWKLFSNPKPKQHVIQSIRIALQERATPLDLGHQTVLITVMKNVTHLNNLIKLLAQLDLQGVPALIIDDEADQASLNNRIRKGEESSTYRLIKELRASVPNHTFLQYTATPQALLLINIIDVLSPSFAEILTPGVAYTGGQAFFEKDFQLIRRIQPSEIPNKRNLLREPPKSLLSALAIYYLGVAAGYLLDGGHGNRSMMIHPSKATMQHANYADWVRNIQKQWLSILQLDVDDPDRQDLVEFFLQAYQDLAQTVGDLPDFSTLTDWLPIALSRTLITEVNASRGKTPEVAWHQDYSHILVGGEVLNRGYTVEGLTVTYMPRSRGVGNADTIQQRARWFGYKAGYLGYCRVYLGDDTINAYRSYVQHEENIREQLAKFRSSSDSLRSWRRAFLLAPGLRPTRSSVLDKAYTQLNYAGKWFAPDAPHASQSSMLINHEAIQEFSASVHFDLMDGDPSRTDIQLHDVARGLPLRRVYEDLLTNLQWARSSDAHRFLALLLQIKWHLDKDNPHEVCTVFNMSQGRERSRTTDIDSKILQLFQGPQYDKSGRRYYPGDRQIAAEQGVTVQIHNLTVKTQAPGLIYQHVPLVAVRLPHGISSSWLVMDE